MSTEKSLVGKIIQVSKSEMYLLKEPFGKKLLQTPLEKGKVAGIATGAVKLYKKNGKSYRFVRVWTYDKNYKVSKAWVDSADVSELEATKFNNGDLLLKSIMVRDQFTYRNLLKTYKYFIALRKAGKSIPKAEFSNMIQCYVSLMSRQQRMRETEGVETKSGFPAEMASVRNSWEKTLNSALNNKVDGIGVIPIVVIIIIVVIVAASAVVAVYEIFRPDYEDSKSDFILSSDLEEKLKKYLPTEVYNQLMTEGEKEVDDAYNDGKSKQKFKDFWNMAKWPVIAFGSFFLIDKVSSKIANRK